MRIRVQLFASLSRYTREAGMDGFQEVDLDDEATVETLLSILSVPREEIKLIFVNGIHADSGTVLRHGDRVGVFPPVAGG
ncbi:MAG: MoaD/ThiS family protein [Desulfobacteraceae bacterium]|jgi:molybdopterin converting factor small subunit